MKKLVLQQNEFHISTDTSELDIDAIHEFLSTSSAVVVLLPAPVAQQYHYCGTKDVLKKSILLKFSTPAPQ